MLIILLSFIALMIIIGLLALGQLFGRKPLQGSCGGMAAMGLKQKCDLCGGQPEKCKSLDKNNHR
jgi:hypothetical protein